MACTYAKGNLDKIDGMVLFAAYPDTSDSLAATTLPVLSIWAQNDGLSTAAKIAQYKYLLPADTDYYEIMGGIHSYFGYYTPNSLGDGTATLTRAAQTSQIVAETVDFIDSL